MAGLVQCKACNKEIAKGVKKCVGCGKDQRNWFMRHKIMTFIGAIIILVIVVNMGGGSGEEKVAATNGDVSTKQTEKTDTIYNVGDTVKDKQLELTVTKFEELDEIGDPSFLGKKASDGGTLVAIQYTMKNVSDEPVGMFSYPSVNLVDEKGTKYDSDIDGTSAYAVETKIDDSKVFSDLNPDISVSSVEVYEVSKTRFAEGSWFIKIGDSKVQIK
ncbi:hypothetical protein J45TS6_48480 [Paenibacillus sp. J45TS6]|uniref:DUF4352 domain-containing protein n=1 Tax=Paenibacillus sp. J45TS6 TaxID=2807196 RepID=UPI001B15E1F1|nr:DUF4352 domain-containing protein [Paenibacillus sp. J45TS6]GIP46389.1 hypothetical protein J45TS6_48480 [Paenibacillus sp. J45TS6]